MLCTERKSTYHKANKRNRVNGVYSFSSDFEKRTMNAEKAYQLYNKLKDKLSLIDPFGMGLPRRFNKRNGNLEDYPLAYRDIIDLGTFRKRVDFPNIVIWKPNGKKKPTFTQFCKAYNIIPIED